MKPMNQMIGRDAVDGYVWLNTPSLSLSGGPDRVVRDEPMDAEQQSFIGFTPPEDCIWLVEAKWPKTYAVTLPRHRSDVPETVAQVLSGAIYAKDYVAKHAAWTTNQHPSADEVAEMFGVTS